MTHSWSIFFVLLLNISKLISLSEKLWKISIATTKDNWKHIFNQFLFANNLKNREVYILLYSIVYRRDLFQFHPSYLSPWGLQLTMKTNTGTDSAICGIWIQTSTIKTTKINHNISCKAMCTWTGEKKSFRMWKMLRGAIDIWEKQSHHRIH